MLASTKSSELQTVPGEARTFQHKKFNPTVVKCRGIPFWVTSCLGSFLLPSHSIGQDGSTKPKQSPNKTQTKPKQNPNGRKVDSLQVTIRQKIRMLPQHCRKIAEVQSGMTQGCSSLGPPQRVQVPHEDGSWGVRVGSKYLVRRYQRDPRGFARGVSGGTSHGSRGLSEGCLEDEAPVARPRDDRIVAKPSLLPPPPFLVFLCITQREPYYFSIGEFSIQPPTPVFLHFKGTSKNRKQTGKGKQPAGKQGFI